MMKLDTVLLSSLHKVYPQNCPQTALTALSGMRNEPLSFQLAYKLPAGDKHSIPVFPRIESELDLNLYSVGYVPVLHTNIPDIPEAPAPGLIGDILLPKKVNPEILLKPACAADTFYAEKDENITLNAADDAWQALWFTVNEDGNSIEIGRAHV